MKKSSAPERSFFAPERSFFAPGRSFFAPGRSFFAPERSFFAPERSMLNAVLFTLIFGVISVLTLEDENSPLKSAMTSMDRDNDFMKRSDSLFEPLTLYKRYYSLDTLGGLGLGKRAEERRRKPVQ
ncbi:unnamed protein product, partial [Mesorhabditis belari]|uniref:Uncharacterized protein n=1 Tax=Mesorhabditis belari TaxID=2138241 RepID=A0AAF3F9V1_9BILA